MSANYGCICALRGRRSQRWRCSERRASHFPIPTSFERTQPAMPKQHGQCSEHASSHRHRSPNARASMHPHTANVGAITSMRRLTAVRVRVGHERVARQQVLDARSQLPAHTRARRGGTHGARLRHLAGQRTQNSSKCRTITEIPTSITSHRPPGQLLPELANYY